MILQQIFIVFGLVLFIDAMFEKWSIWNDIAKIGSRSTKEWIFKLTTCRFCLLFHIGWIVTVIVGLFGTISWPLVIVPFVVGGFIHLKY